MDYLHIRELCLALPGAYEDFPFGPESAVYKVRGSTGAAGKMFALLMNGVGGTRINLKCDPALAEQLRAAHPEIIPGYHMSKKHWNTVIVDGSLEERLFKDLIEDSWDLVVAGLPATERTRLGWTSHVARG